LGKESPADYRETANKTKMIG